MVDNINEIKRILERGNNREFFMIQIIARKKDISGFTGNNRVIKDYYVFNEVELDKIYDEIKKLCDIFHARAYIRLASRETNKIAKDMISYIGEAFQNESYNHLRNIFSTCVGRDNGRRKIWIIDLDDVQSNSQNIKEISMFIDNLKPYEFKDIATLQTPNGVHLITKPFDLQAFKEEYPDIDVHKNNPTVLYSPE